MEKKQASPKTIDEYIAGYPPDVQKILQKVRATIKKAAPDAQEGMSYGVPSFSQNGTLVNFGGAKKHVGFYPTPSAITTFRKELAGYESAKGSVQSPYDRPIPYPLITKIVKFRVKENHAKAQAKAKKK